MIGEWNELSFEYCLPIKINLDRSSRFSILLVALYIMPLIPVYYEIEFIYALVLTLPCLVFLNNELKVQTGLKKYLSIEINKQEQCYLIAHNQDQSKIVLKNSMRIGSILFLLFVLNGKRRRFMVLENQQETMHHHKLKVYLANMH